MVSTEQADGSRRIIWWLVVESIVLLSFLLTLVTWAHRDYYSSTLIVFAIGLLFVALVLPAWAVFGLTPGDTNEH